MSVDRLRPTSGPKPRRRFRKVRAIAETQNGNLLDNAAIAELLIREAETASEHRRLAFKRAARAAYIWREEAAHLSAEGRTPTEQGIRAWRARRVRAWLWSPLATLAPPPSSPGVFPLS